MTTRSFPHRHPVSAVLAFALASSGCSDPASGAAASSADVYGQDVTFGSSGVDTAGANDSLDADGAGAAASADTRFAGCGGEVVTLSHVAPASVLLVVDRSQSMSGTKWEAAKTAIASLAVEFQASLRLGLLMFPEDDQQCTVAATAQVPIALQQASAIEAALATTTLRRGTPTGGALAAAAAILTYADATAPRAVVIATDGQPSCAADCSLCTTAATGGCAGGSCSACASESTCIGHELTLRATALAAEGVSTYVIGLPGSEDGAAILNTLAEIGGTALAGTTRYYTASDADTLSAALGTIAGSIASCSATLHPDDGDFVAGVAIDGVAVSRDATHQEGWDVVDHVVLHLYGSACEAASQAGASVQVTFGCKAT